MHTALCAFDDHATAERARDRLLQAGFARQDVHLRDGDSDADDRTRQDMLRNRGGVEHEIALDSHVVRRVTGFFGHLFGADHPHRETWDGHVGSGRVVLVVDAHDEAEAERARALMQEVQGTDTSVVHRPAQRPMRDILAETTMEPGTGVTSSTTSTTTTTGAAPGATTAGRDTGWTDRTTARTEDRAMASDPQRPLDLDVGRSDSDNDKVGLRYADKDLDKPNGNRDGLGRTRKDE
ncbi:MAG: hypothetical protein ACXWC6_11770 [Ramlibacter sp.]